jgi:hypothetical protein
MRTAATPRISPAIRIPVALLVFSLAMCVATRFVHYYEPYGSANNAASYSPQSKRQDLEKDAVRWTKPVQTVSFFPPPPAFQRLAFTPEIIPQAPLLDKSLFNRPPPSC